MTAITEQRLFSQNASAVHQTEDATLYRIECDTSSRTLRRRADDRQSKDFGHRLISTAENALF